MSGGGEPSIRPGASGVDADLAAASLEDLRRHLSELRVELRRTRDERMATQRASTRNRTVEMAAAAARRDRDALTSTELETLRTRAEELHARLQQAWTETDRIRLMTARLAQSDLPPGAIRTGPALLQALEEETQLRGKVAAALASADIRNVTVPLPLAVYTDPSNTQAHPAWVEAAAAVPATPRRRREVDLRSAKSAVSGSQNLAGKRPGSHGPR